MHILVLNSGSSSLKYKLFDMPAEHLLAAGLVERIGEGAAPACADHAAALAQVLDDLAPHRGAIQCVGHRLVHGGELFSGPALVDDQALARMVSLQALAPLHMPPALTVLRACRARLPHARQVACFDTTFYRAMPPQAHLYAVPRHWHTEHGVRRFGFHGISHQYVTQAAAAMLNTPIERLKLISAHLGNGASITAFDRGRVLDTSMGFTPLEGLIMGTRCGYLDPAVLLHLQRRTGMDLAQMVEILNTQSGLQAVSGIGRDLRAVMAARTAGNESAALAVEMYVHTLRKYIGAYYFALSGAHAVAFTGGVGENSADIRALALSGWQPLGLDLDPEANQQTVAGRAGPISIPASPVKVLVIPTDEERLIARQAHAAVSRASSPAGTPPFPPQKSQ